MLDRVARRLIDPPLNVIGARMARLGIAANAVTIAGLALGLIGAACVAFGHFATGLIFILLGRLLDGLDGAVARHSRKTDFGGYLDITCDFLMYGAVPLAFVLHDPALNGAAGAFLLASFYTNGASFLGYAILAERFDLETSAQGVKSLYYSNGLLEGTETIVFFILLCLFPAAFAGMAWVFGTLCFVTAVLRVWGARHVFDK